MSTIPIEFIPVRNAVRRDAEVILDILVRICPPEPAQEPKRVRIPRTLAIVLDRSGSMESERKMTFALEAAKLMVLDLVEGDAVSLVTFDDTVETPIPMKVFDRRIAAQRNEITKCLSRIGPRGSTNLCGGWNAGFEQIRTLTDRSGIRRVLVLTDGIANVGVTKPDEIGTRVHQALSNEGISTTTVGVGSDYNELLLEAMARSGDGNYYFIDGSDKIGAALAAEFEEFTVLLGQKVTLRALGQRHADVLEILNDFDRDGEGRWKLPNLLGGHPLELVLRLKVPPRAVATELLRLELSWTPPQPAAPGNAGGAAKAEIRMSQSVELTLPTLSGEEWSALPENPLVKERVALFYAARHQREASAALRHGRRAETLDILSKIINNLSALPQSEEVAREISKTQFLKDSAEKPEEDARTAKFGVSYSIGRSSSKRSDY